MSELKCLVPSCTKEVAPQGYLCEKHWEEDADTITISRECAERSLSRAIAVNSVAYRHDLPAYDDQRELKAALSRLSTQEVNNNE